MKYKLLLKRFVERIVKLVVKYGKEALVNQYASDEVLLAGLQAKGTPLELHDPLAYVNFLRGCIEPVNFTIREVKGKEDLDGLESKRFVTLLYVLQSSVPPIDFRIAQSIGLIADKYRSLFTPLEYDRWAGDTGLHFSISSSFGKKGRLLSAIIRLSRSQQCLELGTAYGMSTLFILAALQANSDGGHLTTLETEEPQFSLASTMLKTKYADSVTCIQGSTQDQLANVVKTLSGLDFVFHDAGHTREDFIMDFNVVVKSLRAGSIVLFDDINWDDPRFYAAPTGTHEGWLEVVSHPRVKRAVEINEEMGLLLVH